MAMKLYLVDRTTSANYDEYQSHVVIAETPTQARELCASNAADEGRAVWLDHLKTTCRVLKATGDARVVISNHRAG